MSKTKVISVVAVKGGTGKTTVAFNLAYQAAVRGHRTLAIDADPQGTLSDLKALRKSNDFACVSIVKGRIHEEIESLKNAYDYIIIDVGGHNSGFLRSAILAAGLAGEYGIVIAPLLSGQVDLWGASNTYNALEEANSIVPIRARFMMNKHETNPLSSIGVETEEALSEFVGFVPLLDTRLHYRNDFKKTDGGRTAAEVNPNGKAANEACFLFDEIEQLLSPVEAELCGRAK